MLHTQRLESVRSLLTQLSESTAGGSRTHKQRILNPLALPVSVTAAKVQWSIPFDH